MAKRQRGRPIIGALSGFFFGICLSAAISVYAGIATNSIIYAILPIGGLLIGILFGLTAPFGRRRQRAAT